MNNGAIFSLSQQRKPKAVKLFLQNWAKHYIILWGVVVGGIFLVTIMGAFVMWDPAYLDFTWVTRRFNDILYLLRFTFVATIITAVAVTIDALVPDHKEEAQT